MSLGLYLTARLAQSTLAPEAFLSDLGDWIKRRDPDVPAKTRLANDESRPTLYCSVHPAAEDFELSLIEPARLLASANTITAGPGYHMFLTTLLHDLARQFNATWERPENEDSDFGDETGYFFSGDEACLRSEMKSWLGAIAGMFFDGTFDSDCSGIALCMPLNPQFETESPALTALGPRDRAWLENTAQDPENGTDFWPWLDPGFSAQYYLRRALVQMWTDVRWRPPINESESSTLEDVARCLKRAHDLDPSLNFPWSEWAEILRFLDPNHPDLNTVLVRASAPPVIGYRRALVTVTLPGAWSIRVPGSFSDFTSDDDALYSLDPPREIWFTAYRTTGTSYSSEADVSTKRKPDGSAYFVLNSSSAAPGSRCVCTILFADPADRDWAIDTCRSLKPPSSHKP